MHPTIAAHLDEISAICQEFGVERLELFGSAAKGAFDANTSDFDFLVVYPEGYDAGPWAVRKHQLKERLTTLLGREVDLVTLRNVRNPYVRESIESSRQLLYAA
jgi:predicted nucleotidyltransferase